MHGLVFTSGDYLPHWRVFINEVYIWMNNGLPLWARRSRICLQRGRPRFDLWVRKIPWRDPLEKGNGNPLQYSCLENPMDRGTWWVIVCGVAESWPWLSDCRFTSWMNKYMKRPLHYWEHAIICRWQKENASYSHTKGNSGSRYVNPHT